MFTGYGDSTGSEERYEISRSPNPPLDEIHKLVNVDRFITSSGDRDEGRV